MEESTHKGTGKATCTLVFGQWTSTNVQCRQTAEGGIFCSASRTYETVHRVLWQGNWAQRGTEVTLELLLYEGQIRYYGQRATWMEDYCSRKLWSIQKTTQWKINSLVPLLMEQFGFSYVGIFGVDILWFYQKYILSEQKVVPAVI